MPFLPKPRSNSSMRSSAFPSSELANDSACAGNATAASSPKSRRSRAKAIAKSERRAARNEISSSLKTRASDAKQHFRDSLSALKECWRTTIVQRKFMRKSSLLTTPGVLAYHADNIATESACVAIYDTTEFVIKNAHCPELLAVVLASAALLSASLVSAVGKTVKVAIKGSTLLMMQAGGAL